MAQTPDEAAARQAVEAQLLAHQDRQFAAQRSSADSAKLISTVVLALSGTLVATALQVDPRGPLDITAVVVLGVSVLAALAVMAFDRLELPDLGALAPASYPDADRLSRIDTAVQVVLFSNTLTVGNLYKFASASVLFSVIAGIVATTSLILK